MEEATFDAHLGRRAAIDICHVCHSLWFDTHESATLTPGATLTLFRIIGEKIARPERSNADLARCPRCKSRLRRTHDIQRTTKFEYLSCPHGHGRLTTFFDFLREERLHPAADASTDRGLGPNVGSVNCANCGAPVDVTSGAADVRPLRYAAIDALSETGREACRTAAEGGRSGTPAGRIALPLELERVRRQTERQFVGIRDDDLWFSVVGHVRLPIPARGGAETRGSVVLPR